MFLVCESVCQSILVCRIPRWISVPDDCTGPGNSSESQARLRPRSGIAITQIFVTLLFPLDADSFDRKLHNWLDTQLGPGNEYACFTHLLFKGAGLFPHQPIDLVLWNLAPLLISQLDNEFYRLNT